MSVVKELLLDTVAETKGLASGGLVTKESTTERMSVERLLNQGKNKVAKSMDHITSIQFKKNEKRKIRTKGAKNREFEEHVTKYDVLAEMSKAPSELSIANCGEETR